MFWERIQSERHRLQGHTPTGIRFTNYSCFSDIWRQSQQFEEGHSLESLDKCRISWGKVVSVSGPNIIIDTEDIVYKDGKLVLSPVKQKKLKKKAVKVWW